MVINRKSLINPALTAFILNGLLITTAQADEFSLGLTGSWSSKIYKGVNENKNNLLFPNIEYETGRFWFHGLSTGYDFFKTPSDQMAILGYYLPLSYKATDSHSSQMRKLNDRRSSIMTGVSYTHQSDEWGIFETVLAADALNNSNGYNFSQTWSYPIQLGMFNLLPAVGVNWSDRKFNRYYYGISSDEAARSGNTKYTPGDSWAPFAEFNIIYSLTEQWNIYGGSRYTFIPNEVSKSPMVAKDSLLTFWTGFSYTF
ncbi:MipA/OmpV family protein [Yokenella regensburgei]|uniref:MipA/OmpV family protein n=1 Tax=Yokenella regensburgei TaxID=158877 RepID=UPI003F148BAD